MRLCTNTLSSLPTPVAAPSYDRDACDIGIVHLGIGAFHRAHQAIYLDELLTLDAGNWSICGVSLRNPGVRDLLAPQDNLYSHVERSAGGEKIKIVGSVREVLFAAEDGKSVMDRLTAANTRIVSLTITEKGYMRDPATGELLANDPNIQHDLENPMEPRSAHGFIVQSLKKRRDAGLAPFTVLSCDNLPHNGKSLEQVIIGFARLSDPDLAGWIGENVAFPSTMVDRIVPATTGEDITSTAEGLALMDAAPVVSEPFRQWVIEDCFSAGRPNWGKVGVEMVEDVAPYEDMKLKLLNASHSALAYLGYLGGYETVDQAMANKDYACFIRQMMDQEITSTLAVPAGVDIEKYKASLIERFCNPALKHRTWQIAMDGSQKLPQRILDTVRARINNEQQYDSLALVIAAWMRYVTGIDENGNPIDVSDPMADRMKQIAQINKDDVSTLARSLVSVEDIFGNDLSTEEGFMNKIADQLAKLYQSGARTTLAEWT